MEQNGDYVPEEIGAIASQETFFPDEDVLNNEVDRLEATSPTYQAALQEIRSRNLRARAAEEIAPPWGYTGVTDSVLGEKVQTLNFMADAGSDDSHDYGISVSIAKGIDNGRVVYEELIELVEKPRGSVADPSDVKVVALFQDGAKVAGDIEARSLFSRFTKCLRSGCSSACLGSITACAGVFPVYLKCVIVKCGGCAVKCGACAACNCRFWCKWATGCCKD